MLLRVWVRHASQASFKLPPIKFRHGQPSPSSSAENIPVITTPIMSEGKGNEDNNQDRRREERPRWKEKSRQVHFKDALKSENFDATNYDIDSLQHFKGNDKNRFIPKITNQSIEERLRRLSINVSGEVIYGIFPVLLALQAKRRNFYHLIYKNGTGSENENIQNILNIGEEQGIPITGLKPSQFKKIFQGDQVHQGVCCDASPLPFVTLEEDHLDHQHPAQGNAHQEAAENTHQLWLYLDQIQDPMNFGAVLRSAYFMGVNRVITSDTCRARITSTVSKASAGVAEFFPVHQVKDPVKLVSSLTRVGWEVVSSASLKNGDNSNTTLTDVATFNPKGSILLVVGNEGKGISPELQQMCHTVLTIEPGRSLHPNLHCLNVSVATALLLHSLRQKLTPYKS